MLNDDQLLLGVNVALIMADDNGIESDNNDSDDDYELPPIDLEYWRRLRDRTFKSHFRMNRCAFEVLLLTVGRHMIATNRLMRPGMAVDISLMMTLWILATPDTFRSVGVKFGRAKGSVHNQYKTMIAVLHELKPKFVRWPSPIEQAHIAREFEHRYTYPDVAGCIDCTFVSTYKPTEQPQRYINRHHQYAVIVQAVCDHDRLFRDVYVGEPGAVGDRRTFKRSPLCLLMYQRDDILGDRHLLGDGAYQVTNKLMVPYRDIGNLTRRQRTHNYFLSRCRAMIERAFALLKGKWRRLKFFPSYHLEYLIDSIMACIVLHNFVILEGDGYENEDGDGFGADDLINPDFDELYNQSRVEGARKRDAIATMLYDEED